MREADTTVDVTAAILGARKVPCICPRQHDGTGPRGGVIAGETARSIGYSTARGVTVERVVCSGCHRTWSRVNA